MTPTASSDNGRDRRANRGGPVDLAVTTLRVGVGRAIAHHGELLQGVFEGNDHRLHRGLITLPFASLQSLATFWPDETGTGIRTRPQDRVKAARAAGLTLKHLGYADAAGDLTIESEIPLGHGYGSSTADVIASIRAAAAAAGATLRRSTVSRLSVAAEGASDAIAYGDQAVLFAQREGTLIEHFAGEFPPLVVVGCRTGKGRPVDTLSLSRARYDGYEIEQFRTLRGLASHAVRQQDPRLLGQIAMASARISQRHLRKPRFDTLLELAGAHDACGVQVSHSGTLMGVLFDARERNAAARATALADKLARRRFKSITIFAVCADGNLPI